MILYTNAEYAPLLILMGLIIPFAWTFGRNLFEKSEADKTKDTGSYEMGILGSNVGIAIIGVLATLCIPGMYYDAVDAEQVASGMYLIGLAVALFWAWFGDKVVFFYVEYKRNNDKKNASSETTTTETTETTTTAAASSVVPTKPKN